MLSVRLGCGSVTDLDAKQCCKSMCQHDHNVMDSEKCCQRLNNVFPLSDYYSSEEMSLAKLASQPSADLLLVSAHGYVGFGRTDYLQLGEERIQPEHLVHIAPKLAID